MDRFAAFTDTELSELLIALDHRAAEAHPHEGSPAGNLYVYLEVVNSLVRDIEGHCLDQRPGGTVDIFASDEYRRWKAHTRQ